MFATDGVARFFPIYFANDSASFEHVRDHLILVESKISRKLELNPDSLALALTTAL